MYNNPYMYQNYGYQQTYSQPQTVTRVNGENGARAYQLNAPNSSVLLLDETAPIVWLKQTDGGGYPTLTPYRIEPYVQEKPVDIKSLEERLTKLEGLISGKSDFTENEQQTK